MTNENNSKAGSPADSVPRKPKSTQVVGTVVFPSLEEKAKAFRKAKAQQRSFSNYARLLIDADPEAPQK